MTHQAHGHVHDLSISISAGDVPAHLMPALRAELEAKAQALVDDWLKDPMISERETLELASANVRPHVRLDWDGRNDHDCIRMGRWIG